MVKIYLMFAIKPIKLKKHRRSPFWGMGVWVGVLSEVPGCASARPRQPFTKFADTRVLAGKRREIL